MIEKEDLKFIIGLFSVWWMALFIFAFFALSFLPKVINGQLVLSPSQPFSLIEPWANWDGGHFLGIAKAGYLHSFQYAFFPLFPLL